MHAHAHVSRNIGFPYHDLDSTSESMDSQKIYGSWPLKFANSDNRLENCELRPAQSNTSATWFLLSVRQL